MSEYHWSERAPDALVGMSLRLSSVIRLWVEYVRVAKLVLSDGGPYGKEFSGEYWVKMLPQVESKLLPYAESPHSRKGIDGRFQAVEEWFAVLGQVDSPSAESRSAWALPPASWHHLAMRIALKVLLEAESIRDMDHATADEWAATIVLRDEEVSKRFGIAITDEFSRVCVPFDG